MQNIGLKSSKKIAISRHPQINVSSLKSCATRSFLKERLVVSLATFEDMMHDLGNKKATVENAINAFGNKDV